MTRHIFLSAADSACPGTCGGCVLSDSGLHGAPLPAARARVWVMGPLGTAVRDSCLVGSFGADHADWEAPSMSRGAATRASYPNATEAAIAKASMETHAMLLRNFFMICSGEQCRACGRR